VIFMSTVSKLAEFMENIEEIVTTISEHYQFEVFDFTMGNLRSAKFYS